MPSQRSLLAVCSTLNAAGIFYAEPGLVAPTPRELIESSGRRWHLDHDWLRDWLRGCADPSRTPYLGMRRLQPGQCLFQEPDGTFTIEDTIGPNVWPEPDLGGMDAQHALVEAFDAAIAELSSGRDRVVCELSGGLDSTFMVASLARLDDGPKVEAFTHIPSPDAVLRPGGWEASDEAAARAVAEEYPDRIEWQPLWNTSGVGPLEMARLVSGRAWWPAFGPGNLEWIDAIRNRAAASGSQEVWVGTHGNAAFSSGFTYDLPAARPSLRSRGRGMARRILGRGTQTRTNALGLIRGPVRANEPLDRFGFLTWLAGHRAVHAGVLNPDAFAVPSVDPFRHREVLDTAARIRPEAWRREGMTRGLARSAGEGRVPDEVRLRVTRGAQGLDVWQWMHRDRQTHLDEVDAVAGTPAIAEIVDIEVLRSLVAGWPWGSPEPPPKLHLSLVTRLLGFAAFIRDAEVRLNQQRFTQS